MSRAERRVGVKERWAFRELVARKMFVVCCEGIGTNLRAINTAAESRMSIGIIF